MLVSIKIIKLFINLICESIVSDVVQCFKSDELSARSSHEQEM